MTRMLWLSFDVGTTSAKAALVTNEHEVVASTSSGYHTYTTDNSIVEQNAQDWWIACKQCCGELAMAYDLSQVEAIALTGQMQNLILINEKGDPVSPVILYSDTRAKAEALKVNEAVGKETLRRLTGNDQDVGSLLAKLMWIQHHDPERLTSSRYLLFGAADYVVYQMVGLPFTDTTTASTTGLMGLYSYDRIDEDVLNTLGVSDCTFQFPQFVKGGSCVGQLLSEAAVQLGLKPGIPVHLGPGDAGAATIGIGSGELGRIYGYLGTSGWIAFTSTVPANTDSGAITLAHPRADYFISVAPLLTAGGNLQWVQEVFEIADTSALIDSALERHPTNILYLPYLNGERSPFRDPLARGAFVGLNQSNSRADMVRAVLEGVAYGYRHAMSALVSAPVAELVLTGGGARSDKWCQLFADILGIPVKVLSDAENVGVIGAVVAAQVSSSNLPDYHIESGFGISRSFQPQVILKAHHDRQYRRFLDLYKALIPIFESAE